MSAGARGRSGAGVALAACLIGCGRTPVPPAGIVVRDARAFEALVGATAAAYFTVVNGSDSAEVLDSVTSVVAVSASIHTQREQDGFVTMTPLERPSIAPRDSLVLRAGGDHLMLETLDRPLVAGDVVPLVLWFHRAGRIEVSAQVSVYGS